MISIVKTFDEYCYLCKFRCRKFYEDPCYECIHDIANSDDSRKPVNFKEKKEQ